MKKLFTIVLVAWPLFLFFPAPSTSADTLFRVLHPHGPVAATEHKLLIVDVAIMLAIVVPTIAMAAIFVHRYRASNTKARYEPNWARSKVIEMLMWGIPLLAIGALSYFVYTGNLETDPYQPAAMQSPTRGSPLEVDVISLDWKWLFVYPQQHIATVDTLEIPVHRTVYFKLTSATVTNSFFIPQLAGQIYAMPGMRTKELLQASQQGTYAGFSAAQSGAGFSWMRFKTHCVPSARFKTWVQTVKGSPDTLSLSRFHALAQPDIDQHHRPQFFSAIAPHLFKDVVQQVKSGRVYPTPLFAGKHM